MYYGKLYQKQCRVGQRISFEFIQRSAQMSIHKNEQVEPITVINRK